jgi:uncharacterized UPF0160 family protein
VNAFTGNGLTLAQTILESYVKQFLNWRKQNTVIAKLKKEEKRNILYFPSNTYFKIAH